MNRKQLAFCALIGVALMWAAVWFAWLRGDAPPVDSARSKAPALPLAGETSPEDLLAQDVALSDPRVQDLSVGRRAEVFAVKPVGMDFPAGSEACAQAVCRQVEIYLWAENATVAAIVNVDARQVLNVLYQPGVQPGLTPALFQRAAEIIRQAPEVVATLGFQPPLEYVHPMQGDLRGSACAGDHICAGATFQVGDRFLWAVADLTTGALAGISWSPAPATEGSGETFAPQGCPQPGTVARDGWELSYETTATDGFRVFNVVYQGYQVLTSVKLVEWHVDYGETGFRDWAGCGPGTPLLSQIAPYGETQIRDLLDGQDQYLGFELVQDFRMSNWGANCNYRYDQRLQFFVDGRFRVVSGAYGRGCGTNAVYRPVVRINLAIGNEADDNFAYWDGNGWVHLATEDYRTPTNDDPNHGPHQTTPEGFAWRVFDQSGMGYNVEMDVGQWEGADADGDLPFVYATLHDPAEGDSDLGWIGECCNDDHVQGPDKFVNGEAIANANLVLWYVPQAVTNANSPDFHCWTVSGEPNPETYPCFMGPMFHPFTSFAGTINLEGQTDHSGALVQAVGADLAVYTTMTDVQGNFLLDVPAAFSPTSYDLVIQADGFLSGQALAVPINADGAVVMPELTLPAGDVNGDDQVNILDLALIGSHFGVSCGEEGWDERADVNADCTVNQLDLDLAAGNFRQSGPVPWE